VDGRRAAGRPLVASLWLPGPDGEIALAAPFPGLGAAQGRPQVPETEPAVLEQAG
jgi:hypothetical protein